MSDNFDKLIADYKEYSELVEYSRSQFRVITDLSRKIQKLEEDNKELKKIADKVTPIDINSSNPDSAFGTSDPEIIARTQLALLKKISLDGEEMTLEESKKVQIFTDVLLKSQKKEEPNLIKDLNTKDLLALIESDNGNNGA